MDRIKQFRNKEFDLHVALLMLLLLIISSISFFLSLFTTQFIAQKVILLTIIAATTTTLVFNKNLLHLSLRPIAIFLLKTFFSIEVEGENNIPSKGRVIFAGNHTGLLDALIVSVACKRPVNFIMTNEIFSWPYVGKIVGLFNVIPVTPKKGIDAINKGVDFLENEKVLCIFPEGKCSEDGKLNRFHRGVARLQSKSNAPIVPFAIEGGFEAWPIAGLPKPYKIVIRIGQALELEGLKEKEVTEELKSKVQFMKDSLERRERNKRDFEINEEVISFMQAKVDNNAVNDAIITKENNDWNNYSYTDLSINAISLANNLIEQGINKGDRVAILSESNFGWSVSFFASIRSGAIIVPIDIKLTKNEIKSLLLDCTPSVLFVSNKFTSIINELKTEIDSIKTVYNVDKKPKNDNFLSIFNLNNNNSNNSRKRNLEETALIVYTSGTTGNPKGVKISFENIISQIKDIEKEFKINSSDTFLSVLPLNHMLELTCGLLGVLNSKAKVVYTNKLNPKNIINSINEHNVTYMIVVPALLKMIKSHIDKEVNKQSKNKQLLFDVSYKIAKYIPSKRFKRIIFRSIHKTLGTNFKGFISGGAALDIETARFFDRLGIAVYQGYGMTETSPVIAFNSPKKSMIGSVGKPLASVTVRFTDENEIIVKGPNIMQGYHKRESLTKEIIDKDGWLHTGDIGKMNKKGYLYITGRIKNLIVLDGGKKIHPEELEMIFNNSDLIKESCVIGVNKPPKLIEEVYSIIVPSETLNKTLNYNHSEIEKTISNEVKELCKNIASYKRPSKTIICLNELPKTATNKIKRKEVMKLID